MDNFYFTFGRSETMPFQNGWIIVMAESKADACVKFMQEYPHPQEQYICNCAFIYSEKEFKKTIMYKSDNLGAKCHRII